MDAAEDSVVLLEPMPDDAAAAMEAGGCERLDLGPNSYSIRCGDEQASGLNLHNPLQLARFGVGGFQALGKALITQRRLLADRSLLSAETLSLIAPITPCRKTS